MSIGKRYNFWLKDKLGSVFSVVSNQVKWMHACLTVTFHPMTLTRYQYNDLINVYIECEFGQNPTFGSWFRANTSIVYKSWFDLDLWPCDLDIDIIVKLLSMPIQCVRVIKIPFLCWLVMIPKNLLLVPIKHYSGELLQCVALQKQW